MVKRRGCAPGGIDLEIQRRDFNDTVCWCQINSEKIWAASPGCSLGHIGFGATGIMLYMFTNKNLKQHAVRKATCARSKRHSFI